MFHWTRTGCHHLQSGEESQDALLHGENAAYTAAAVADGVGSCRSSGTGAQTACRTAIDALLQNGDLFMRCDPRKAAAYIAAQVRQALSVRALRDGHPIADYASTLLCCLRRRADDRLLLISLGDSMPLCILGDEITIPLLPGDSSCGIRTTADDASALYTEAAPLEASEWDRVILCTDGAWGAWFDRGSIRPNVADLLRRGDYGSLTGWMQQRRIDDDSTFAVISKAEP